MCVCVCVCVCMCVCMYMYIYTLSGYFSVLRSFGLFCPLWVKFRGCFLRPGYTEVLDAGLGSRKSNPVNTASK